MAIHPKMIKHSSPTALQSTIWTSSVWMSHLIWTISSKRTTDRIHVWLNCRTNSAMIAIMCSTVCGEWPQYRRFSFWMCHWLVWILWRPLVLVKSFWIGPSTMETRRSNSTTCNSGRKATRISIITRHRFRAKTRHAFWITLSRIPAINCASRHKMRSERAQRTRTRNKFKHLNLIRSLCPLSKLKAIPSIRLPSAGIHRQPICSTSFTITNWLWQKNQTIQSLLKRHLIRRTVEICRTCSIMWVKNLFRCCSLSIRSFKLISISIF